MIGNGRLCLFHLPVFLIQNFLHMLPLSDTVIMSYFMHSGTEEKLYQSIYLAC